MESTTFQRRVSCFTGIAFAGLLLCSTCFPLRGDMMLTAAGTSEGLALSTFATGFPVVAGVGPLGIAFLPGGSVVVSDYPGNVRVFTSDVDGQNAAAAPVGQNYGQDNAFGLAQVGGHVYMGRQYINNDVAQLNNDGTFNQIITPLRSASGLIADPVTGHLFVSTLSDGEIWNVDPVTKTATLFASDAGFINENFVGLAISPDGSTLYGATNANHQGLIQGWNTTTGALTFDSGNIPGAATVGVGIGTGAFAGQLFATTGDGQLWEINPSTLAPTLIATGGSAGTFLTTDPTNGSLLLTQTDRILRLTFPASTGVPEPNYFWLSGFCLAVPAAFRLYRKFGIRRGE